MYRPSLQCRPRPIIESETTARSAFREGSLEFPADGYRRVLAELKRRDLACPHEAGSFLHFIASHS